MSKQLRTLLIAGIAVVVLVALLLVMLFSGLFGTDTKKSDTPATEDNTITLLDKTTDANGKAVTYPVTRVHLTAGKNDYSLALTKDNVLTVEGWEKFTVNTEAAGTLVKNLSTITAAQKIADTADDLSTYGLAEPALTVTVTYHDGAVHTFLVGNETPSTGSYYFCEQGKPTVYTISEEWLTAVNVKSTAYLDRTLVTAPAVKNGDANGKVVVRSYQLSGSLRDQEISIREATENDSDLFAYAGYVMLKPYFGGCSTTTNGIVTTMSTYTSVTADDVAAVNPTAAQLTTFGLDKPYSVLQLNLAVETYTTDTESAKNYAYYNAMTYIISLGKQDDNGNYYATISENGAVLPVVYLLSKTTAPWAESTYNDLASTLLFLENITDIDTMTVTANGKSTLFQLKHNSEATEDDDMLTVTSEGTKYSTADFRNLYADFLGIQRTAAAPAAPSGKPVLTVRMTHIKSSEEPTDIQIYAHSANVCIAKYSNGDSCAVLTKKVNQAIAQIDNYLNGKKVITY